jgi:peptidoglycan/LPS O-acetylase OafA/YrhL
LAHLHRVLGPLLQVAGVQALRAEGQRQLPAAILGALSRVTSSGRFIAEIDGLRFVAIASVVVFHAHNIFFPADPPLPGLMSGARSWISYLIHTGWFGVQLFFIISGFILAMPFAEQHLGGGPKVRLGRYLLRRVTRLEPPYLISLVILACLQLYYDGKDLRTLLPHFLAHATYLHGAIYGSINSPGYVAINHVLWSLEIEVQFYLLAPLLCFVFAMRGGRWPRRAAIVAGIVAGTLVTHYYGSPMLMTTLAGHIRWFLIGFLLADVYLTEWRGAPGKCGWWDLAGGAAWAGWPILLAFPRVSEWAMPGLLLVAYLAAFRGRILNRFFANPWIAVIGGMCYTIYLYHTTMLWWVRQFLITYVMGPIRYDVLPGSLLQLFVLSAAIVIVSVPLFLWFEKRFMRRRRARPIAEGR